MRRLDVIVPVVRWSGLADATLRSLREHLGRPEALRVVGAAPPPAGAVGPAAESAGDIADVGGVGDVGDVGDVAGAWNLVLDDLGEHPERDLLVVLPGILAAPLLDLRLQWSAYTADEVALVSPLCDLDPATSLARHGVHGLTAAEIDDRLARLAGHGPLAVVDAPYFLPECAFVRADLVRRALGRERPRDPAGLVRLLRREGLLCGFAPHVFVECPSLPPRPAPWLDAGGAVSAFLAETPLHQVALRLGTGEAPRVPGVRRRSRPRLLHVSHSLGGGLERWVDLFTSASPQADNFVLKSIGERGRFGSQLWLYEGANLSAPVQAWKLAPPIEGSVVSHLGYRRVFAEIVRELGIDGVVVSSLIGHSLDALRSSLPTVMVFHDYFPFCSALHIAFEGVCRECGEHRLAACLRRNPLNDLFDSRDPREWLVLREAFLAALSAGGVRAVAPSPSVARHLRELAPQTAGMDVAILPHGSDARDLWLEPERPERPGSAAPLRVVVLGRVTAIKGEDLLREVVERAGDLARFWLVGCGDRGRRLAGRRVEVVERYERQELPAILARIAPDAGLFLSIVPETFSFTLDECFGARIPPVALRTGSFGDRIEDGVNGFLCDPDAGSVLATLERLAAARGLLAGVREELRRRTPRSAVDMVADYARVLGLEDFSPRAYFAAEWGPGDGAPERGGYRLPAGSPLGFAEYFRQVETGTLHHIQQTRRLKPWQRTVGRRAAAGGFRMARLLMRWLVR
ncbi:MAG: hypothetical protein JF614_05375 [Acidobacteria bacterium]|nr:hypothetical protein [Acidobacteriota bacterium]